MDDRTTAKLGAVLCAVTVVAAASTVQADDQDYAPSSQKWYGLSEFVELARSLEFDVHVVDELSWEEVHTDDVIAVVYPESSMDAVSKADFVSDGGRMLVADHYGDSEGFLQRLSVDRDTPRARDLPHHQFVDDHPGWPRFHIGERHALLEDVDEVVANYPAVLHNVGGPVIAYDDGGGLIYDMMLGDGRAVLVADPSLFINAMLSVADNRRLAANIWQYLCGDDCRIWVLVRDYEVEGTYTPDGRDEAADRVDSINSTLQEAFEELPKSQLLYALAILLVFGTMAYLLTVFRWRRPQLLSEYIQRQRRDLSPPLTEYDWNVSRFANPDGRINYALPVALLKESFEDLLFDALERDADSSRRRASPGVLARRFEEQYLDDQPPKVRNRRRQKLEQLLSDLANVPTRHRIFLESDEHYSGRDMERFYNRIQRVLQWMGLQESYERQTRQIEERYGHRR